MANPLSQDDLLDAVERQFPDEYIEPIKNIGPGWEIYQGMAMVGARCSVAVSRSEDDGYIMTSTGPRQATVAATFYRATAGAGAGTVLAGTLVSCSVGGQVFRTIEPAIFGGSDLEMTVQAIAVGYGYEWNILGEYTAPNGDTSPGELDTITRPLQSPPYWDPTILVRNDTDADGLGHPGTLDALGDEREIARQTNEGDPSYRGRIRALPDTVSPAAIRRQITRYLKPYPTIKWDLIETWEHRFQECYDAPEDGPTAYQAYDKDLCCYDDPRAAAPIRNRYMDANTVAGCFIVEMQLPPAIDEFGACYDDTGALTEADYATPLGRRAISAYDVPFTIAPPTMLGCYDGYDVGLSAMLAGLYDLLDAIKAAGVLVVIHIAEGTWT